MRNRITENRCKIIAFPVNGNEFYCFLNANDYNNDDDSVWICVLYVRIQEILF